MGVFLQCYISKFNQLWFTTHGSLQSLRGGIFPVRVITKHFKHNSELLIIHKHGKAKKSFCFSFFFSASLNQLLIQWVWSRLMN